MYVDKVVRPFHVGNIEAGYLLAPPLSAVFEYVMAHAPDEVGIPSETVDKRTDDGASRSTSRRSYGTLEIDDGPRRTRRKGASDRYHPLGVYRR